MPQTITDFGPRADSRRGNKAFSDLQKERLRQAKAQKAPGRVQAGVQKIAQGTKTAGKKTASAFGAANPKPDLGARIGGDLGQGAKAANSASSAGRAAAGAGSAIAKPAGQLATLSKGTKALGKLGGRAIAPAIEGYDLAKVVNDPKADGFDVANQVATGSGRLASTALGALAGQAAIPIPVIGALAGGAAGYFGSDKAIEYGRKLFGAESQDPAEKAPSLNITEHLPEFPKYIAQQAQHTLSDAGSGATPTPTQPRPNSAQAQDNTPKAGEPAPTPGQAIANTQTPGQTIAAPSTQVYRSRDPNGAIRFSDQQAPGAQAIALRSGGGGGDNIGLQRYQQAIQIYAQQEAALRDKLAARDASGRASAQGIARLTAQQRQPELDRRARMAQLEARNSRDPRISRAAWIDELTPNQPQQRPGQSRGGTPRNNAAEQAQAGLAQGQAAVQQLKLRQQQQQAAIAQRIAQIGPNADPAEVQQLTDAYLTLQGTNPNEGRYLPVDAVLGEDVTGAPVTGKTQYDTRTGRTIGGERQGGQARAKPSLDEFIAAASQDPRNSGVSREDLIRQYRRDYGAQ